MRTLRPYQRDLSNLVRQRWAEGARNVLMRLDTGGGKTEIISDLERGHAGASAVIAHRNELVSQLSLALARNGIRHGIIAASDTTRAIARQHMEDFGQSFYDPSAKTRVIGIDTMVSRQDELRSWAGQVTQWTVDEGHHVVRDNKWETGVKLFTHPQCRGLLPTATPRRADGKGLGRHADGVADCMVQGPPMRWLIEEGWLTDYRVVCPDSDMELLESEIGASGDWSTAKLRAAAEKSHIVGDVVDKYREFAANRLGVTFAPDTKTAEEIMQRYRTAGIAAGLLTGKTDPAVRRAILRDFRARRLLQLAVVDIVSEGFDLPAIEVGVSSRKTASLATYMQQFGRTLRPIWPAGFDANSATREQRLWAIATSVKSRALWIDHVGNFLRHGPPDRPRDWSLDRAAKRSSSGGGMPYRVCVSWNADGDRSRQPYDFPGCWQAYERFYSKCPHCDLPPPPPQERSSPKMVDGVMSELDPAVLAALRGEVALADMPLEDFRHHLAARNVPTIGQMQQVKLQAARQEAQAGLREAMGYWGGVRHANGLADEEIQRAFYLTFGIDVLSAMALGPKDAEELRGRVWP